MSTILILVELAFRSRISRFGLFIASLLLFPYKLDYEKSLTLKHW